MSKNLIYANADEFHVKSTLVYADGTSHQLYWDSEHAKPIYSDELKRLFFAGGLKICCPIPMPPETGDTHTMFLSPIAFDENKKTAFVACLANLDNMSVFSAPVRSISSDDSLPSNQGDLVPLG